MQSNRSPVSGIIYFCPTIAIVLGAFAASIALAQGPSPVDPGSIESGHPTGHLHDHANDTWPPQSRGIRNAIDLSNPGSAALAFEAQRQRAEVEERRAMVQPELRSALGDRYVRATFIEADPKTGPSGISRLVYFSHSRNETVTVTLDREGIRSVSTTPASEYQPEITDDEIAQAEAIARSYFMNEGHGRISALQGFGILAYKPTGNGFYDQRVLYISFHLDNDSPPEFVAWVDLTSERVLQAREERQ